MNIIKVVMILFVIVVTIVIEFVILTGQYAPVTTVYEKLPNFVKNAAIVKKGTQCAMKGTFLDYMGRPLQSETIDCTTCEQYMSKNTDGYCRTMKYNGSACAEFGDSRPCPKKT